MIVKTLAIVISAIKYQEKSLIVNCFTEQLGMQTYFIPSAYSSKKSASKIAFYQPLQWLELEAYHLPNKNLQRIKEVRLWHAYNHIPSDLVKSSIAIFLAEILKMSLHEQTPNQGLFAFLQQSMHQLEEMENPSTFPVYFLIQLTKYLGFYPDDNFTENSFFDLQDASFHPFQSINALSESQSNLFYRFISNCEAIDNLNFSYAERQQLLTILLQFYQLHQSGFYPPKSLEVLQEVLEVLKK